MLDNNLIYKILKIQFNFRLQITILICISAFLTPFLKDKRMFHLFKLNDIFYIKIFYVLAAVACFLSFILRTWGTAYLSSYKVMAKNAITDKLIINGPFLYVRNPLYLGDMISAFFIGLLLPPIGFFLMSFVFILHNMGLAIYEEKQLAYNFKEEYINYKKSVNRFIPKFKPFNIKTISDFKPNWKDAILANFYILLIGFSFIIAILNSYELKQIEYKIYFYSITSLIIWIIFYFLYYFPKHFKNKR